MQRRTFSSDGIRLSALDTGGDGPLLLCLHALWMQGATFQPMAERLFPGWRVVAPDFRGHGQSDRASDYSRDAIDADLVSLITQIGAGPAAIIGNSIGGTFAIQLAARHPDLVRGIVNEEGQIAHEGDLPFMDSWRGNFPDRTAFARAAGHLYASLAPSVVENPDGTVGLGIEVDDLKAILASLKAGFEDDWQRVRCPVMVVAGADSKAVPRQVLQDMVTARPGTQFAAVPGSHVVHEDNLAGFLAAVTPFLDTLRPGGGATGSGS